MNETQNFIQRKLQYMYRQVETLVLQLLDKVTDIYHKSGIKYFIKPTPDFLMRLLTPYELKVYVDIDDINCLFQKSGLNQLNSNLKNNTKQMMRKNESSISIKEQQIPYLRQCRSDTLIGNDRNIYIKKTKREREREIKQFNKNRIKENLVSQLLEWGKNQVNNGQIITRKTMSEKALQIGKKYEKKFGMRWLNKLISFDFQLRNLLTHGNSSNLKKDTKKELSNKLNSSVEEFSQEYGDNNSSEYGIDEN